MKLRDSDRYSPNQILLAAFLAVGLASLLTGRSLWIPASRIENLHIRAIALAAADAVSSFASEAKIDSFVPAARDSFLSFTGLAEKTEWDTRYFNRRTVAVSAPAPVSTPAEVPASTPAEKSEPILPAGEAASLLEAAPAEMTDPLSSADAEPGLETAVSDSALPKSSAEQPMNAIHSAANPLRLYMFGDSQVYSLGNGLSRLAGKDSPVAVDFLAVHSSGFIRGDYFNWPAKLADTLSSSPYDGVVMMLGMNDYQNFWNNRGEIMKKHTPEWEAAYAEKCSAIIDTALLYVPRVYWVGMPRVKDPQYEESLRYIDGVQDRIAARYGPDIVIRCPIADALPGSGGGYLANVTTASGKIIQAMSADGNHFTVEGGQYAMSPLFRRLATDWLFSEIPIEHLGE